MSYNLSPNMNLPIPVVGNEPGPNYAQDINNSLTLIDGHDHSPGSGTPITPSGLNINATLDVKSNFINNIAGLTLTAPGFIPGVGTIYESGTDLYFVDGLGNNVRITQSGGVAGSPGSIANLTSPASASYVAGTSTFVWQSNTNIAANMDFGAAIMRNLSPNSTFALTLQPPAALGSNYSLTLPTVPSVVSFLTVNNSGVISSANPFAITSKGDLIVGTSGGSTARLGVSSDGQVLTSDSTATNGLSYKNATNSVILTKTGDYTLQSTDSTIIADATSASFTLTLPAASSVANQKFLIKRKDAVITHQVTISGTIDGATDWKLYTQNETLEIQSDGTNYYQIRHDTLSPTYTDTNIILATGAFATTTWTFTITSASVTSGAVYTDSNGTQFTATQTISPGTSLNMTGFPYPATAPGTLTKVSGTGASTLSYSAAVFVSGTSLREWRWHREGNYMVGQLLVTQTGAAGTLGSGDYTMTIPSGQSADTNITPSYNGSTAFFALGRSSLFSTCNILVATGSQPQMVGQLTLNDSTSVRMVGQRYSGGNTLATSGQFWNAGSVSLSNTSLDIDFSFRMPISGWKP